MPIAPYTSKHSFIGLSPNSTYATNTASLNNTQPEVPFKFTYTLNVFVLGKADKIALRALFTDSELVKTAATSASNVTVTMGAVLANLLGFAFE